MTKPIPLSDLVADDLLLDRVAGRRAAGEEPVERLLAALAAHADRPLGQPPAVRRAGRRRVLSALAALAVGASGAGVAAAVTTPEGRPSAAPAVVAPGPKAPGHGAALVRDTTGQVVVRGADGRTASPVLPSALGPAHLLGPSPLGRASGSDVSRARWAGLTVSRALVVAGLESPSRPVLPTDLESAGADPLESGTGSPGEAAPSPPGHTPASAPRSLGQPEDRGSADAPKPKPHVAEADATADRAKVARDHTAAKPDRATTSHRPPQTGRPADAGTRSPAASGKAPQGRDDRPTPGRTAEPALPVPAPPDSPAGPSAPALPTVPEPRVSEPGVSEPGVPEPGVPEPVVPEAVVPGSVVPGSVVPESDVPESDVPETAVPGPDVPETAVPGPDVPGPDVPGPEVPGVNDPAGAVDGAGPAPDQETPPPAPAESLPAEPPADAS
ncbi:hypothetical protein [Intrasporangium sp. DVR]|uniref:hypothetical protein n=1 Tax=Intrasporangium sp. DVR TaxID=3127867 RepID=UPI00313A54D9